jgi:hypothetical protein
VRGGHFRHVNFFSGHSKTRLGESKRQLGRSNLDDATI